VFRNLRGQSPGRRRWNDALRLTFADDRLDVAGLAAASSAARGQGLEHVRFTGVPTDDMTPIYWAVKNGLYEKTGIDLEIVPATSGSAATTAVISGTYEMGKSSPLAAINAVLRGLPIVIVGNGPMWDAIRPRRSR
jgi:ABC-type nitrate/sulfonate/bicarbonate transport system substrate-binding protein